jgi:hypothetical protein
MDEIDFPDVGHGDNDDYIVVDITANTTTESTEPTGPTDEINATTTTTKKPKQVFPPELESFGFNDRHCLICGNEKDRNSGESFEVAQKIVLTNASGATIFQIKVSALTSANIRKLARNFGLKNLGSKSKFEIRLALAEKKNHVSRFNIDALATKNNSSIDNTKNIIRIINAVFHPDNYDAFLTINNRKDRKDFEYGNGSNNNVFWSTIADFVNDASNVDLDSFYFIEENEDYNKYISKAMLSGQQPIGCSQQTGITCKSFIENVVKIRGTIISNMGKSGCLCLCRCSNQTSSFGQNCESFCSLLFLYVMHRSPRYG